MKTLIRKNDKVVVVAGAAAAPLQDPKTGESIPCTVLKVDRNKGFVFLEAPKAKRPAGGRETPRPGVEQWKTVRYNPQAGEAGGLKITKKKIHLSNLSLVCPECGKRKFSRKVVKDGLQKSIQRVCRACSAEF